MSKFFRSYSIRLSENNSSELSDKNIQIFKAGIFSYWEPGDMILSKEIFNSMIINFNNNARGVDIAIDYDHCIGVAAGWIKELYLGEDQVSLFAKVEWTKEAEAKLKDNQYKYISGEFVYEYEDEKNVKHGPTLLGAALTNRPFLKSMKPVTLNEQEKIKMDEVKKLNEQISELKIQASVKDAEIKKLKDEISLNEIKSIEEKKTNKFNEMLKEGKVCEAQREAYMQNDVVKFSELAMPLNLSAQGTSRDIDSKNLSEKDVQEEIIKLAEKKEGMSFRDAIHAVLKENPELAKKYKN
jgi:phage I-like protein